MNIQTTGFDYSTLDAETRDFLLVKEANIRQYGNKATDAIVGMGREFNDAKAHTEHGEFTAWVAKRFPHLSMDSVQNYMRMAALVDQKPQFTVFGVSVLGLLAKKSTPEKARIEAEAYLKKPDKATVEAITGLIDSCKPAPRSRHQKTDPAPENETIVNEDTVDPIPPEESIQPGEKPASVKGAFQSPATTPPVGLIKRHNVPQPAELMGNLHPVTVTPDEKSNVMAGAFASTNGNGAHPVDSTKLQAEITRLKAENAQLKAQLETHTPKMIIHMVRAAWHIPDNQAIETPAEVNAVMKAHGEATTRAALGLLIQYKVKPLDFQGYVNQLVKTVKAADVDPAEEQRKAEEKAAKKAAKIVFPQSVNSYQLHHLMEYYARNGDSLDKLRKALGIDTDMIHWDECAVTERREYIKLYQELELAKVNPDCYGKMVTYARSNWPKIPVAKMAERISEWKQSLTPVTPKAEPYDDPRYHTITHPDIEGAEIPDYVPPQQVPA